MCRGEARIAVVIKIGTNILSQTVQRYLMRSTEDLSTTSQRLSSGQRINSAADDAAGLSIAQSLNVGARIFAQGVRNLNDGISSLSITEGAMTELGGILARLEELSSQSINGTFSDQQRASLQKEATALTAEWNRIVESTTFNGQTLMLGSNTRTVLQGGKGVDGALAIQIGKEQLANGIEGFAAGTTRISTDSSGAQGNGYSSVKAISADGRYLAFHSDATNLVTGDSNGVRDGFVKDSVTGITTRVSTSSAGVQGNGDSTITSISADGRFVVFLSDATNLVSGDTNGAKDAFIKDLVTGSTTRINTTSDGTQTGGVTPYGDHPAVVSGDGRYVAFSSTDSSLVAGDTNGVSDIFVKDLSTGTTTRANIVSSGGQSDGFAGVEAISPDGRFIQFFSEATNLVAGDTNGSFDAFVTDTITGKTTRLSTSSTGVEGNGDSYSNGASADGRYFLFGSHSTNLISGDTNGEYDTFVKDALTGTTIGLNFSSNGTAGNGRSVPRGISADGRFVTFESTSSNLVADDTNGVQDVFRRDLLTGEVTRISIDSAGNQGTSASYAAVLSADGRFVAFYSDASNLVAGDTNTATDSFLRDLTRTGVQMLAGIVISDQVSAKITLSSIQNIRAELLDARSKLGASTSRIRSFINTLESTRLNYQAASSRIIDADIADEMSRSISAGIRQQVGAALLAQANQAPQVALALLKNA